MLQKTRNILVFLGLLIVSSPLFAQQNKDTTIKHKILLVPFKPVMFMNEIGRAVNTKTHLSYDQITKAFRFRLDLALYTAFKQTYATASLIQAPKQADTTLTYIYKSVNYSYDLLPGDSTSSGENHAEFDPTLQKKHFINRGQLQVPMDYSKRFMNAHIANPHLLGYLNKKYGADIIVFINELDIKNISNSNTEDLTESNYKRLVIVQYSIINLQKHYLAKGVLTTYFPYAENDPKVMGKNISAILPGL